MPGPLVTIATYDTPVKAEMARNRLEQEGITALLADAEAVNALWYVGSALGGVKLQVPEGDALRARAILDRLEQRSAGRELDDYGLPGTSRKEPRKRLEQNGHAVPEEDETLEVEADAIARRAWWSAVIGLVICPPLLHFYSVWLLLQLPWAEEPLSPAGKRAFNGAVVIDILVVGLIALLCLVLVYGLVTAPLRPALLGE